MKDYIEGGIAFVVVFFLGALLGYGALATLHACVPR